jgi:hypothetical protein
LTNKKILIKLKSNLNRRKKMKKYLSVGICLFFLVLMAPQVSGETISFGDNTLYWAGWPSQFNDSLGIALNTWLDAWGTPNILGGSATINDNGYLTSVTFDVQNTRPSGWDSLLPADLFIDTDNDKIWDYVVNLITPAYTSVLNPGLYAIDQPLYDLATNNNYIISNVPGYSGRIRDNHPIGVTGGTYIGPVNFSGWPVSAANGATTSVSFILGDQDILLGSNFALGWTVTCANDVIYAEMNHQVPEPATLFLLGAGIIGLVGVRRKGLFSKRIG